MSTVSFADVYGGVGPTRRRGETAAPADERASSWPGDEANPKPAYFWAGMVALLILARVLWERGK